MDKMRFVIGVLKLAKAEGVPPPPGGLEVHKGRGQCRVTGDKVILFDGEPLDSLLARVNDWILQAMARAQAEAARASTARVPPPRPATGPAPEPSPDRFSTLFDRIELDDRPAPAPEGLGQRAANQAAKIDWC